MNQHERTLNLLYGTSDVYCRDTLKRLKQEGKSDDEAFAEAMRVGPTVARKKMKRKIFVQKIIPLAILVVFLSVMYYFI